MRLATLGSSSSFCRSDSLTPMCPAMVSASFDGSSISPILASASSGTFLLSFT